MVKGQAELEMLALDSKESFDRNKSFYRERMNVEELPAIRKLLEQDSTHLDCIQALMASSREFYLINVLEPKCWSEGGDPKATAAPEAFRKSTLLAQHISFLKDFFRAYKDFTDAHIDTIEIMLSKLYAKFGITDRTNFCRLKPQTIPSSLTSIT